MKKALIIIPLLLVLVGLYKIYVGASHVSHGPELEAANINLNNHAAIQRGARMFVNYCMGCHSAEHVRYKQLTKVGLSEQLIAENLMFAGGKIGDQMKIAMPERDAKEWFGNPAPDLSLVVRLKHGPDWVYSYLKGFYLDPSRPMGVNNTVFPNVGMPHVLAGLQGWQKPVMEKAADGKEHVVGLELASKGSMSAEEYDAAVRDLTTFLTYIGEPVQVERQRLGYWVLLFLAAFSVLAYLLKKEYWKDIH